MKKFLLIFFCNFSVFSNEENCLFLTYNQCINTKLNCCKIEINDEKLCLNKEHLYSTYLEKLKEKFADVSNQDFEKMKSFDYQYRNNICLKWLEINSSFFNDIKIYANCQCKSHYKIMFVLKAFIYLYLVINQSQDQILIKICKVKMTDDFSLEWEERDDSVPVVTHMIAGSLAGIGEHVLLLPIDNIKTHVQTTSPKIQQAFFEIRQHGLSNFFKGSAIIAAGVIPAHAIFFANYEIMKKYLNNQNQISIFGNMALGGISTLFHDIIMTPADLIKQRAQILKTYSIPKIIKNCYQTEGLKSFWRSLPINLFSNLPSQMITVSMNENLKFLYKKYNKQHSTLSYFMCAFLSGFVSSIFVTPLDNIKTRLNVQILQNKRYVQKMKNCSHQNTDMKHFKQLALKRAYIHQVINGCQKCAVQNKNEIIKYPNTSCAIKIIKKEEGFRGFYKGFMLRTCSQSLSAGISWTIYEVAKKALLREK